MAKLIYEDFYEDNENNEYYIEEIEENHIGDMEGIVNYLYEGDNLHSLREFKKNNLKVDVIYIDPPYNTRTKKGYKDCWTHDKWLSFMRRRLELAYDLLKEDGVIFVSIDDNEQAHLKLLMDDIFLERNFISNMIYKKTGQQQNNGKNVAVTHEYILLYAKGLYKEGVKKDLIKGDSIVDRKGIKQYKYEDEKGLYRLNPIQHKNVGKYKYTLIHPLNKKEVNSQYWTMDKTKFNELDKNNMIHWTENLPNVKKYIDKNKEVLINNYLEGFYNEQGDTELKEILGYDVDFNNPKNVELVKRLIGRNRNPNAIILDFFAGSGTTGQAVLELNKEDGGNRQFILCTNNENNICREITHQRIKKVIEGYTTPKNKQVEGIGGNLKYYKIDTLENSDKGSFFIGKE